MKAEFFHMNLCFQKEKTLRKCVFTTTVIYFASLTLTCKTPHHPADFVGDKNVAFDFSKPCRFGHPVYFDYQDFFKLCFSLFIPTF